MYRPKHGACRPFQCGNNPRSTQLVVWCRMCCAALCPPCRSSLRPARSADSNSVRQRADLMRTCDATCAVRCRALSAGHCCSKSRSAKHSVRSATECMRGAACAVLCRVCRSSLRPAKFQQTYRTWHLSCMKTSYNPCRQQLKRARQIFRQCANR